VGRAGVQSRWRIHAARIGESSAPSPATSRSGPSIGGSS
jgi:hypothetical protein